jgi:hypothetical protein
MINSPYLNQPVDNWKNITQNLVNQYPISQKELLDIAIISWSRLWGSVIGGEINISEVELPATVIGYFFQKLFSHELSRRYPQTWKGEELKSDKDLVNKDNCDFSTEMKASGQLGYSLFGNRSYNQESESSRANGKDKSGFYITLNFYGQAMTLLRIGWIDQDDWVSQGSETGQAATLKKEVYDHKLLPIYGNYMNQSPIQLLHGIGPKLAAYLHQNNVYTFKDLKNYRGHDRKILLVKKNHRHFLAFF